MEERRRGRARADVCPGQRQGTRGGAVSRSVFWQPTCVCVTRIGMLLQKQRNQHRLPLIQKARASLPASFVSAEAALTARRKQPSDGERV